MDIANFVLTFGPASLVVYSIGSRLIKNYRVSRAAHLEQLPARRERPPLPVWLIMSRQGTRIVVQDGANPNAGVRAEIPLPNGVEPQAEPFVNRTELALNAEEIAAVARMIEHNRSAAKPSKSSTIAAGFGVSRGGSPRYTRAALIYDALFGAPAPAVQFRELTPEHQAQLQLRQKGALN